MLIYLKFLVAISVFSLFLIKYTKPKIFSLIYDKPDNKRKFHSKPIPLLGGIIIFFGLIIFSLLFKENSILNFKFFLFLFLFFLTGFIDDILNLKAYLKLIILILLIILFKEYFIFSEIYFYEFGKIKITRFFNFIFMIFCILIFINSSNMIDGIDGSAITYFISISLFLLISGDEANKNLLICLIIIFIFLLFLNLTKKIFLGDGGIYLSSILLCHLIIQDHNLALDNNFNYGILYAENIFLIMFLPGIDMLRLFVFRLIKGKSPLNADRNHFHHLLQNKYNNKISILIMNLFYFLPLLSSLYFEINKFIIILLWLYIYAISIIYLNNAKNN